jgi:aryl-alcohol dehydrogenase-like predicted oxidoreductase
MQTRPLGNTGLSVSVLGFGGAPIGFLPTEQAAVSHMLNTMLDQGVNLIDTAAMYQGSEELIAHAVGHRRGEFVLVSKCGAGWNKPGDSDWSAAGIARYIDRSLDRLRTDAIDVMMLHSCDLATLQKGEALGALVDARAAGKIRFAGYSGDNEAAAWAAGQPDIRVVETSINIVDQVNLDMLMPAARQRNLGVIAKRPVANAAWKPLASQPGMYQSYAKTYTERFAAMNVSLDDLGLPDASWPEVALRFTLSQPGVSTAIVGTTNPDNFAANRAAAEKGPLPDRAIAKLRQAFLSAESNSRQSWPGQT